MTRVATDQIRSSALSAFLDERTRAGYRVETRTATQAVIVRRRLFRDVRLVVSVDSEGRVDTVAAEPRRW